MENPDVELELSRDVEGNVTRLAYKVNTREDDNRSAMEFCSIATAMLEAEGHEVIGIRVDEIVVEDTAELPVCKS